MAMRRTLRVRFWVELAVAVVSLASLLLTLASKEWIEALTGVDPDHGSGAAEWALVAVSAVAMLACAALSGVEWRRACLARA